MSRLERLLNLTAALLTAPRPLTAVEISERVPGYPPAAEREAFRRAFERDKTALREMGVPIELEPVPGTDPPVDGYVVPRDEYELRDPGLEPDELAAIHLATATVRMEGLRAEEALWKLGGSPADDAGPAVAALPAIPQLVPLFAAVTARRPVTFGYRGAQRRVDPWRLTYARGRWYLEGFDHERSAERQFRLDRLEGEVVVGEAGSFDPPPAREAGAIVPWQMGDEDPVTAVVRIDADQAGWVEEHLGAESVRARLPDGAVEVAVTVTNRDAFRSFVLGFLEHAEVLAPPALRADVVAWLRAVAG